MFSNVKSGWCDVDIDGTRVCSAGDGTDIPFDCIFAIQRSIDCGCDFTITLDPENGACIKVVSDDAKTYIIMDNGKDTGMFLTKPVNKYRLVNEIMDDIKTQIFAWGAWNADDIHGVAVTKRRKLMCDLIKRTDLKLRNTTDKRWRANS